jgi:hypothetical protein
MNIRALSPILLLASILVQPWAYASDEAPASRSAETSRLSCADGAAGCNRLAAAGDQKSKSGRRDQHQSCAPDSQDCDTRGESQRDRAAAELRDRHAGRD